MNTLAIDIGGTKFSLALFSRAGQILRRETRSTDRDAGRDALLPQIIEIGGAWRKEYGIDRCGAGFGS